MNTSLSLSVSSGALIAILVATVITYLWRAGGYWAMGFVKPSPRIERALAALPGSIVAAIVLPAIARTGPVAAIAIAAALIVKIKLKSDILAMACGMIVAVVLRAASGLL